MPLLSHGRQYLHACFFTRQGKRALFYHRGLNLRTEKLTSQPEQTTAATSPVIGPKERGSRRLMHHLPNRALPVGPACRARFRHGRVGRVTFLSLFTIISMDNFMSR